MKLNQTVMNLLKPFLVNASAFFIGIVILLTGCSSNSEITFQQTPGENMKTGEMAEMTFIFNREIINPYNSNEIKVNMIVWLENGDTLVVPAFYYVPYAADNSNLVQNGNPSWKVRFTPQKAGKYYYFLSTEHKSDVMESDIETFQVSENSFNGFIKANRGDRLFRHAGGEVFFPSGLNLAHPPHTGGPLDYDYFFGKMKENNMNFMRIWLTPQWGKYAIALEWTDTQYPSQKGNLGLRKINSEMAYRLDSIMESALNNGIYVMLCLLDERELEEGSHWKENPYNTEAGGVISEPMDFFSDTEAKDAFQNRLRYLIARYSAYPNLFAWEFWNEFDHHRLIPDWETMRGEVGNWHHEMSRYLKQNDPHNHMVSTSVVGSRTDRIIWDYEEMDFVQAHSYTGKDHLADRSHDLYVLFENEYPDRPFFIGEMGTDWHGFTTDNNAENVGLHNGLWESSLGGHSATGMWWWWYELDHADVWNEWKSLAIFTEGINRENSTYHYINADNSSKISGRYVVSGDSVWVWFYNRDYNWKNIKEGKKIDGINPARYELKGIPAGSYRIMRFTNGTFTEEGRIESDGTAHLQLPLFRADYAALLVPDTTNASAAVEKGQTKVSFSIVAGEASFEINTGINEAIVQVFTLSGNLLAEGKYKGTGNSNRLRIPPVKPQVLVYRIVSAGLVESGKVYCR